MEQNDYNLVKPVDGLQNVGTLNPIQPNAERKPRRQPGQRKSAKGRGAEVAEQQSDENNSFRNNDDQHSIDFRA